MPLITIANTDQKASFENAPSSVLDPYVGSIAAPRHNPQYQQCPDPQAGDFAKKIDSDCEDTFVDRMTQQRPKEKQGSPNTKSILALME
jgi:hypothetical protein